MSTELLESNGLFLSRFYGGESRGMCYQITVEPNAGISGKYGEITYIQLTRAQMEEIVSALVKDRLGATPENLPDDPGGYRIVDSLGSKRRREASEGK